MYKTLCAALFRRQATLCADWAAGFFLGSGLIFWQRQILQKGG